VLKHFECSNIPAFVIPEALEEGMHMQNICCGIALVGLVLVWSYLLCLWCS
jgi:hypothetical protein